MKEKPESFNNKTCLITCFSTTYSCICKLIKNVLNVLKSKYYKCVLNATCQ